MLSTVKLAPNAVKTMHNKWKFNPFLQLCHFCPSHRHHRSVQILIKFNNQMQRNVEMNWLLPVCLLLAVRQNFWAEHCARPSTVCCRAGGKSDRLLASIFEQIITPNSRSGLLVERHFRINDRSQPTVSQSIRLCLNGLPRWLRWP